MLTQSLDLIIYPIAYGIKCTLFIISPFLFITKPTSNIVEIRIDSINVLTQLKRPLSKRAQDIGIWLTILDYLSRISIIVNAALIALNSDVIPRLTYTLFYNTDNKGLEGYINSTLTPINYYSLFNETTNLTMTC